LTQYAPKRRKGQRVPPVVVHYGIRGQYRGMQTLVLAITAMVHTLFYGSSVNTEEAALYW
ncbi:hypothetical protein, partial [Desulfovibrio legallii]|uniref:hypothetical protein n=1 Tax=Desulfovibrio legallii TaxID=571438 RepID=UPI003A8D1ED6